MIVEQTLKCVLNSKRKRKRELPLCVIQSTNPQLSFGVEGVFPKKEKKTVSAGALGKGGKRIK